MCLADPLGLQLIAAICKSGDTKFLVDNKIEPEWLYADARQALLFVQNYFSEFGHYPSPELVGQEIGHVISEIEAEPAYLKSKIINRYMSSQLEDCMRTSIELLSNGKSTDAARLLQESSSKALSIGRNGSVSRLRQNSPNRLEQYKEELSNREILGIPTKWPSLNRAINCWENKKFTVIAATASTGKSWLTLVAADDVERTYKKNVLYVTMEMSKEAIFRRLDAIRLKIPYSAFRRAQFDSDLQEDLENGLTALAVNESTTDIHIADKSTVKTVHDVVQLVSALNPDIVFIDGGYRLRTSKKGVNWESAAEVVEQLQLEAEASGIPWVVSTQMNMNKKGENTKSKDEIRYAREWVINPDNVIQLYQNEDLRLTGRMQIDLLKIRDADSSADSFFIRWDLENMDFNEIGDEEPIQGISF